MGPLLTERAQFVLQLTRHCAQSCLHCPDSRRNSDSRASVSGARIAAALDRLAEIIPPERTALLLTGGEPADSPAFLPVVKEIVRRNFAHFSLATNGIELDRNESLRNELLNMAPDELIFSLDGNKTQHAWLRDSNLSYGATMRLIARIKADSPGLLMSVNFLVHRQSLGATRGQVAFLNTLPIDMIRLNRFRAGELQASALAGLNEVTDPQWEELMAAADQDFGFAKPILGIDRASASLPPRTARIELRPDAPITVRCESSAATETLFHAFQSL